jgi:hypothetical protein
MFGMWADILVYLSNQHMHMQLATILTSMHQTNRCMDGLMHYSTDKCSLVPSLSVFCRGAILRAGLGGGGGI